MYMANIEVRIPQTAKEYVMHDTSEEMRNAAQMSVELEIDVHTGANWYEAK